MSVDTFEAEKVRWRRLWARQGKAPGTLEQYVRYVEMYRSWCAERGLQTTSLDSADLWVEALEGRSKHAARHGARSLKAWGAYLAEEYGNRSPFDRLVLPVEPKPVNAHTATDADYEALMAVCRNTVDEWFIGSRDRALIATLAYTGARRSEVIGMTVGDDLDLASGVATLRQTKSGDPRTIRLVEPVVKEILGYLKRSTNFRRPGVNALWLNRHGKPLTPNGLSQMMERRCRQAGIEVTPHSFRRRQAGQWMAKGGSETGLMTNNGWTTTAMIRRYTKDTIVANTMAEVDRLFGDG